MNSLSLQYFLAAADHRSITRAAEALFVTQQNISNHIIKLEKEFGIILFDRKPELRLTYAGEQLYRYAKNLQQMEVSLQREMSDIAGDNHGAITIGIPQTRSSYMLSRILPEYHREFPHISLRVVIQNSNRLNDLVEQGDIDVFIGFASQRPNGHIKTISLNKERLCAVVPYDRLSNRYPDSLRSVTNLFNSHFLLSEFVDEEFLLPSEGSRVREAVNRSLRAQNLELKKVALECPNIPTLLFLAREGMGLAFSFESMAQQLLADHIGQPNGVFVFPMDEKIEGDIVIGYSKEHYLSKATKHFIDKAISCYNHTEF